MHITLRGGNGLLSTNMKYYAVKGRQGIPGNGVRKDEVEEGGEERTKTAADNPQEISQFS